LKKSIGWKEDGKKNTEEVQYSQTKSIRLGDSIVRQSRMKRVGIRLGIVKDKLTSRIQALEMDKLEMLLSETGY